ncbi:hypothetical protein Tco_0718146 [Tanacetum coccineum]
MQKWRTKVCIGFIQYKSGEQKFVLCSGLSCASDVENKSGIHTIRPRFYSTDAKKKKLDTPDHTIRALKNTAPMNIKNEEIEIGPVDVEWNKAIGNRMKKQRSGYKRDDVVLLDMITAAIGVACSRVQELAIPGQTATGKESSNPFMAGSLPKTIHFCDSLQSDEDSFELIELMILCTNFLTMVRDLENLKTTYLIMKKVWVRMHPNRGGLMMQMQRLPSLMRLQMMLETRTTRFQTAIRSEEVFGYILLVIKKLTLKKLDD